MTEFLHTVADHYFKPLLSQSKGEVEYLQLTEWMFVFPNRRAGLFFNNYLCELNGGEPLLAPRCITIGDIFNLLSDYRVADKTELLFLLYKVYNEVRNPGNSNSSAMSFEEFLFWGEMLLRDFDEVDKYLVPADKLFCNIKDIKSIESEFEGFDEETLTILRTFWEHISPLNIIPGSTKESFTQTWAILYEVYSKFRKELRKHRIAYDGMRQRDIVERLDIEDIDVLLSRLPKHIVLVGITAINRAERKLFLCLKSKGVLECCWDYAEEHVSELSFVKENLSDFGNVLSLEELDAGIVPIAQKRMKRMAIPSGAGQTSEVAKILSEWPVDDSIHTAVVLPNEHLLDAMLYNLPSKYVDYNVTMGCSLKSTPVASLVESLISLQANARCIDSGKLSFYYKTVLPLLSHSFLLDLEMEQCTALAKDINCKSLYQIPQDLLLKNDLFRHIFRIEKPIPYLRSVLKYFLNAFKKSRTEQSEIEDETITDKYILIRECLISYLQVIDRLEKELSKTDLPLSDEPSLYRLIQKLAQGISVSYSGEPLKGLQIMGVLETRAVDFERVVLLSMNEGVIPAKPVQNSFIPHSLRKAFGLPTQIYKDLIFAYHFYRLIGRASEVVFLYDCRADGMQTGEQSRYLLQLEYLSGAKFEELKTPNSFNTPDKQNVVVEKTPEIMALLDDFKPGGSKFLSASNLKLFIDCPLQFYLAQVRKLSTEDEMDDEMDDAKFGTILHDTLKRFYSRFEGNIVLADVLRKACDDPDILLNLVKEEYKHHFNCSPDNGYQQLVCSLIATSVKCVLEHDIVHTPFVYLAGECKCTMSYQVSPSLTVNLKAIYDRLDIVRHPDHTSSLRVVDYKTGSPKDKLNYGNIDKLFDADNKCSKEAFQVLLYCMMLEHIGEEDKINLHLYPKSEKNAFNYLEPNLYFTRSFLNEEDESRTQVLPDFGSCRDSVEVQMRQLIERIFNQQEPFGQTDNEDNCKYCKFTEICNKNIKND